MNFIQLLLYGLYWHTEYTNYNFQIVENDRAALDFIEDSEYFAYFDP